MTVTFGLGRPSTKRKHAEFEAGELCAPLTWRANVRCQRFFPSRYASEWFEIENQDKGPRLYFTQARKHGRAQRKQTKVILVNPAVQEHIEAVLELDASCSQWDILAAMTYIPARKKQNNSTCCLRLGQVEKKAMRIFSVWHQSSIGLHYSYRQLILLDELRIDIGAATPEVIVTDKEQALRTALTKNFPDAQQQLCVYQILANARAKINAHWKDTGGDNYASISVKSDNDGHNPSVGPSDKTSEQLQSELDLNVAAPGQCTR